jgi:hypothetical protein
MGKVYSGILDESIKNMDQLFLVMASFKTQMSDAARLELIAKAASEMEANLSAIKKFNAGNISLSISRSVSLEQTAKLKELYGVD